MAQQFSVTSSKRKIGGKLEPSVKKPRPKKSLSERAEVAKERAQTSMSQLSRELDVFKPDKERIARPTTQQDQRMVLLRQASKLARLSRQLEKEVFTSKKNGLVYSLLNVYQQQATVAESIINITDLDGRIERLTKNLVDPFARAVATSLISLTHSLNNLLHDKMKEEHVQSARATVLSEVRRLGGELQKHRNEAVERIPNILIHED